MTQTSPSRSQQSYRHEALLWDDPADFTAGLVPFVAEGLEDGEPVMVALVPEHTDWLRDALGSDAGQVTFVDMHQLGSNPARIIPAWLDFLSAYAGGRRPARGIGEPIWLGRRPEELLECQLHEALLNVAVDPETPFWLICPYDAKQLDPAIIAEAYRSHPVIRTGSGYTGSNSYLGRHHVDTGFAAPLSDLGGRPYCVRFTPANVTRLRGYLKLELYVAGLGVDRAAELATAFEQLARTSLRRGATGGEVKIWVQSRALVCELTDDGSLTDPLVGRRAPAAGQPDGHWSLNQLGDLVQVRSTGAGTTVRVYSWT